MLVLDWGWPGTKDASPQYAQSHGRLLPRASSPELCTDTPISASDWACCSSHKLPFQVLIFGRLFERGSLCAHEAIRPDSAVVANIRWGWGGSRTSLLPAAHTGLNVESTLRIKCIMTLLPKVELYHQCKRKTKLSSQHIYTHSSCLTSPSTVFKTLLTNNNASKTSNSFNPEIFY